MFNVLLQLALCALNIWISFQGTHTWVTHLNWFAAGFCACGAMWSMLTLKEY